MSINYDQIDYFNEIPLDPNDIPRAPDEPVYRRSYCTFGNSLVLLVVVLQTLQIGVCCYLYLQYAPTVNALFGEIPLVSNLISSIKDAVVRVDRDLSALETMLNQSVSVYSRIDRDLNVVEFFLNQTDKF